jgi:hypothetical protein
LQRWHSEQQRVGNGFDEIDLELVGDKKTALFVTCSDADPQPSCPFCLVLGSNAGMVQTKETPIITNEAGSRMDGNNLARW